MGKTHSLEWIFFSPQRTIHFLIISDGIMAVIAWSRDVQEPESEPESSKFFRSRIGLGVKFNVKTGVGVGAGATIS